MDADRKCVLVTVGLPILAQREWRFAIGVCCLFAQCQCQLLEVTPAPVAGANGEPAQWHDKVEQQLDDDGLESDKKKRRLPVLDGHWHAGGARGPLTGGWHSVVALASSQLEGLRLNDNQ
jgi:hypothetical protein